MIPGSWSVSGLTTEDGLLDRPLAYGSWRVPEHVQIRDGELVWHQGLGGLLAQPGPRLFEEFLRLGNQPIERIAAFARRWGVLGICEHGLPLTHNPPPRPAVERHLPVTWCIPMRTPDNWAWEPVDTWQRLSLQMQAVLNLAARLYQNQLGRDDDWKILYYKMDDRPVPWWKRVLEADRSVLTVVLNEWLAISGIQIVSSWESSGRSTIGLSGGSLFAAVTLQLAMAVSRTEGLAICSSCGSSYVPSRRPRADQRRYCKDCRDRKVPLRDAATDRRRRKANGE